MIGFKCLACASLTALFLYSIGYLVVNISSVESNENMIPLLFSYVLKNTTWTAWPLLIVTALIACL